MSRAYTEEEIREEFLGYVAEVCRYWANLPDKTPIERCEGVGFSIINIFNGVTSLPAFDIVVRPHPDDKQFHIDEGENYYEDGTVINDCHMRMKWSDQ